ncbi:glycosyltransferase [Modestobacter sp. VKM Ac-2985]|uniref:glycosyltransferase n=1 Tax=Modestobacter sp. VKM Ac-2985 TaxID=3004139 RepID=UPI0022ABAD93|nr:glycosyltransferase [Modestobacter sp. VKM Ac-2985]MCZ2836997.1 glycosyltransferase [Modestobacter sp. VKM Ac-2985]
MKILIAADTYAPDVNGASYFAQRLAAGLATEHEVHVLVPSRSHHSTSAQATGGVIEHRVRSVPVLLRRGFRICPPAGLQRRVRAVLRTVRPDVVHIQSHFLVGRAVLRAARTLGIPVVATNHFMPENLLHHVPGGAAVRRRAHAWAWRDAARVLALADVVTSPTPFAAALAESAGVPGPVLPISCGLDLDRFSPDRDGARFRRSHGLPSVPVLAYVGRLDPEKNVHELIEAVALVRARWDLHLLVVGDGSERTRLEALAAERGVAGAVTFTGVLSDAELPEAYAAADFFGMAGTAELQSLVTLEAMATGLPVLGVDAGALPHLVRHGRTGWLYGHGDVEELAGRLTTLLDDPASARRMGRRARAVAAEHDLGATLSAFVGLYDACLRSRTPDQPRRHVLAPT